MDASSAPHDLATLLALAAGLGWTAGLRLYTMLFVVGLAGRLDWVALPPGLQILADNWVLAASGLLLVVEFFADKVPLLDSLWDTVHTFIRIPAGAAIAALAFGAHGEAWQLAMALLGGSLAAGAHAMKAGTRATLNLSPEPFTNIGASLGEDALALGALWLILAHPLIALALLVLFVALLAWLLPKLWRVLTGRSRKRAQGEAQ